MARDTTISISEDERERLAEASVDLFGTDEVPYAATIMELIERCEDVE